MRKRRIEASTRLAEIFLRKTLLFWMAAGSITGVSEGWARGRSCRPAGPDKTFKAPEGATVLSVAVSPDGDFLAAGTNAGSVLVFAVKKSEPPVSLDLGGAVRTLLFLSDEDGAKSGGHLIAAGGDFGLKIVQWENDNKYKVLRVLQEKGVVMVLAHDERGRKLASAGRDRRITIWNMKSWEKERVMKGHNSWVSALVFSTDGGKVFSGGWDNTVRGYRVSDGKHLWTNYEHRFAVNGLIVVRDGKTAVSISDDGRLRLIRTSDGRSVRLHRVGPATGGVFMGGGGLFALAVWRGRIMLLSYPELRPVGAFSAQLSPVRSVAGLASGLLVVGGGQGKINLWVLPTSCIGKKSR